MPQFTQEELTAFRAAFEPVANQVADTLAECVGGPVTIGAPACSIDPVDELSGDAASYVHCTFSFGQVVAEASAIAISASDALAIASLISGTPRSDGDDDDEETEPKLSDAELSQVVDVLSGVVAGLGISLGKSLGTNTEPDNCDSSLSKLTLPPSFALIGQAITVDLPATIKDSADVTLHFYLTPDLARAMSAVPEAPARDNTKPESETAPDPFGAIFESAEAQSTTVASRSPFQPFEPLGQSSDALHGGIGLIMDIPLDVTVELGRVKMLIKDVLDLSAGSIVELERVAGEPVDLVVNGRLVAKGEVVVIEDNFGIRITEIISPSDRLNGVGRRAA